jgi:hypothetical protein
VVLVVWVMGQGGVDWTVIWQGLDSDDRGMGLCLNQPPPPPFHPPTRPHPSTPTPNHYFPTYRTKTAPRPWISPSRRDNAGWPPFCAPRPSMPSIGGNSSHPPTGGCGCKGGATPRCVRLRGVGFGSCSDHCFQGGGRFEGGFEDPSKSPLPNHPHLIHNTKSTHMPALNGRARPGRSTW